MREFGISERCTHSSVYNTTQVPPLSVFSVLSVFSYLPFSFFWLLPFLAFLSFFFADISVENRNVRGLSAYMPYC
jgi:hypothetical protein